MPDILIIHTAANYIGKFKTWDLLCEMKRDFYSFKLLFPQDVLVFFPK